MSTFVCHARHGEVDLLMNRTLLISADHMACGGVWVNEDLDRLSLAEELLILTNCMHEHTSKLFYRLKHSIQQTGR